MAATTAKKHATSHPPYTEMVCRALMTLDKEGGESVHGHGLAAIKKVVGEEHKLPTGWEKHLTKVIQMMVKKKQLTHVPGHVQTYHMTTAMKEKMEHKRGPKKDKEPKKKMAKATSPAKRAKKADMPKTK